MHFENVLFQQGSYSAASDFQFYHFQLIIPEESNAISHVPYSIHI